MVDLSKKSPRIILPNEHLSNWKTTTRIETDNIWNNEERNLPHLGIKLKMISLDEVIEKRSFPGSRVSIGIGDTEWYYCIHPIEGELTRAENLQFETIIEKLPEIISIDTSDLLKDQKLARELVRNAVISYLSDTEENERIRIAELISRYTIGYGVLETLLEDPKIEDIIINSPVSANEIYVATGLSEEKPRSIFCRTNVILAEEQLKSIITRARVFHGGELSASKPVLELEIPYLKARLSGLCSPASPHGLCLTIRRSADHLWTLPRLIAWRSVSWSAAGFLSLCCSARVSIIIAGGRGSGKTTLLSSLLPELPNTGRILVMEDTEELPVLQMQRQNMSIQRVSIAGGNEKASAVMKAALRMGEGPMIIGEIRGEEANILFESMRTGTANSSVIGTLHASDPYAVRDRIVLDMSLSEESFRAIDIIVMAQQRRAEHSNISERFVSEISVVANMHDDRSLTRLFSTDHFGNIQTHVNQFKDLESIGHKFESYLGIDNEHALAACRIRGYLKKIQASEWERTGNDDIVSISAIKKLNNLQIDYSEEIDFTSLKEMILDVLREETN